MWIHLGTWVKGRVREGRERDVCFCFFFFSFVLVLRCCCCRCCWLLPSLSWCRRVLPFVTSLLPPAELLLRQHACHKVLIFVFMFFFFWICCMSSNFFSFCCCGCGACFSLPFASSIVVVVVVCFLWPRFLQLFLLHLLLFLSLSASFSGSLCVSFCALKFLFHELDSSRRCKQCDLGFVVPMCVRVCVFWF